MDTLFQQIDTCPDLYAIRQLIFVNSAAYAYTEIRVDQHTALFGRNNLGKTSMLNALKLFLLPEENFKMCDRKFGFRSKTGDSYSTQESFNYYFPDQNSFILLEAENLYGPFCILLHQGRKDFSYARIVVPCAYEKIRHLFWDFAADCNEGLGAPIETLSLSSIQKTLHAQGGGQQLKYASVSIRSYASDVEKIRRSLERYVRQNARQRLQYNAIETAFYELLQAAKSLQDGSLKNNVLRSDEPVFQRGQMFSGLRAVRYSSRLEWHGHDQRLYFAEFLRVRVDQLRQQNKVPRVAELDAESEHFERHQQYRKETIRELVRVWVSPDDCNDLHKVLHDYLQQALPDYQLVDLLEAMKWCVAEKSLQLKPVFRQRVIEHEGFELMYYMRALEPAYAS